MADSAPSKPKRNGMQDALDPQSPASLSRPLRADFSFPPRSVIRSAFQLAKQKLSLLRRTRWNKPAPPKPPDPHADRSDSIKRDLDDTAVILAAEDLIRAMQNLEEAFERAAETMSADTMIHSRNELAKGVRSIKIPARALENLPLVDPDKAWRD